MGTKTRSSSELKSILTEVFTNGEFHKLFNEVMMDNFRQLLKTEVCHKLEEANREINDLKTEVRALKSEIIKIRNESGKTNASDVNTDVSNLKPVMNINKTDKSPKDGIPFVDNKAEVSHKKKITSLSEKHKNTFAEATKTKAPRLSNIKNQSNDSVNKRNTQISRSCIDRSRGQLIGMAKPKKGWLYLGSISNKNATPQMIIDYLQIENIPQDELIVEKLDSKGEYSSFMIGIPFEKLDQIGNPDYWPKGVSVRRYNFWKKRKDDKEKASFLEE